MTEPVKKYTLPISPEYCEHWGLWEAVREIYQNALDESGAEITYCDDDYMTISSATGHLTPKSLLLGSSSKRSDPTKRGKFGEGYKLALLVLSRLGHSVVIQSGNEVWIPKLEHEDSFGSTVLNVYINTVEPEFAVEGVHFQIQGITSDDRDSIQKNIRDEVTDTILDQPDEVGRIYVGGLYVSTVKNYKCGYAFAPGTIKLDRDRGMVDGFDLAFETSRLWQERSGDRAVELMNEKANDVLYIESHVHSYSDLALHTSGYFATKYGNSAIPVSDQEEIKQATSAGLKWVLVPESVKNIIRLVKHWILPSEKSPLDRLKDFRDKYDSYMQKNMLNELDEIIESLDQ